LFQPFVVGAVLALLLRLLLIIPGDLYARVLGTTIQEPAPGSVAYWIQSPVGEEGFLRLFVLATWWLGAVLGVVLVWQRGGRWTDMVCGTVAGAGAGLAGSATLACGMMIIDALPRVCLGALFAGAGTASASPALGTFLWILLAPMCWAVLGGGAGFLLCGIGRRGARVLAAAGFPLAQLFRLCRMERAADFFVLQG
jgi:hypothetical protein